MKLLVITQVVDDNDPLLGFFTGWIRGFSERVETVVVVGLQVGTYSFPANVSVHSLGKEWGNGSRLSYILRSLGYIWKYRNEYDAVFVHQNQEYVLLAGLLWKLLGKKVYLWRNHYAGSMMTRLAVLLATNTFCTSRHSYTAPYKKNIFMPVGVDTEEFSQSGEVERVSRSILFLARMTPSKHAEVLIDALIQLKQKGVSYTASFVGSPIPGGEAYYQSLIARAEPCKDMVQFLPGVAKTEAAVLFRQHEIFVNCSPSGMFDKTLFEAGISGALVVASSADYAALSRPELSFVEGNADSLAQVLEKLLASSREEAESLQQSVEKLSKSQGLNILMDSLIRVILKAQ